MTSHVVQFSGGMGSYATARRVKEYEGKDELYLLFADTLIEDDDLYRFVIETAADLQDVPRRKITVLTDECKYIPAYENGNMEARKGYLFNLAERARKIIPGLIWIAEGRDVWETMFDSRYLGNSRIDPCSKNLKRDFLRKYLDANFVPEDTLIYLGIDFTEKNRFDKAKDRWLPFECKAPLCEPPYFDREETKQYLFKRGIKQPRLYDSGMEHNNCGGACIKMGQKGFKRLLQTFPERFFYWANKEQEMREYLDKDVSILRKQIDGERVNYTLYDLKNDVKKNEAIDELDEGGCGCVA